MKPFRTFATLLGVTMSAAPSALCQTLPPVRQLGPVTAVSHDSLGAVSSIRALPNGRLLVNDIVGRRVLLFDSALAVVSVVADTTSATANAYGTRPGGLFDPGPPSGRSIPAKSASSGSAPGHTWPPH